MLLVATVSLNAQEDKRALKPISFRVMNIRPTTAITNEPVVIQYRLEYLLPSDGNEVKILSNLDKDFFQSALAVPVDVDMEELKKKLGEEIFDKIKVDSGPRATISDFYAEEEKVIGNKVRRDFTIRLKVKREKITESAIPLIRLDFPEVAVSWAVARLGQKEGEYENEDPIKSQKVRINHALTTPTHDPNLNFRSTITVPQYSASSVFWYSRGVPALAVLVVGFLVFCIGRTFKQSIYATEVKNAEIMGQVLTDNTGVKRLTFQYAITQLRTAVDAVIGGGSLEDRNNLATNLYIGLYNFLLAAIPTVSMGSFPSDFIRILEADESRSAWNDNLKNLAALAQRLRPIYEAIGSEEMDDNKFGEVVDIAKTARPSVKKLGSLLVRILYRPRS